jgi:hypothetical protein
MFNRTRAAVVAGLSSIAVSAHAAVPGEVTSALTAAAVDVAAVAGLALLVYLAPKAFKYMRGGL